MRRLISGASRYRNDAEPERPTIFHAREFLLDAAAWMVAVFVAVILRVDLSVNLIDWIPVVCVAAAAVVAQMITGLALRLYQSRTLTGSLDELKLILVAILVVTLAVGVPVLAFGETWGLPRSTVFIAAPFAGLLMGSVRSVLRIRYESRKRPDEAARRTLIYGAGYLGSHAVRRMLTDRLSPYRPVGFIDDDPAKQSLRIDGVPVLGTADELEPVAKRTGAEAIVIGIARADAALLRSIADAGSRANLQVLVFPELEEVLGGRSRLRDVRDIEIEDLIGRHPVDTDVESMAGYLKGRRVLVTGAGGSIGAELARQIVKFEPAELVLLDRDETGLQTTQFMIERNGLLTNPNIVLNDIRDTAALFEVFERKRPDVVFHAAALKHLPMLERYPREAWKTNVVGTLNVLRAALAVGVPTFVNISTDKAANPTSVLGHSKRLAERLTAWAAQQRGGRYLSVRFGNVLGSRGSIVPLFAAMIEAGGPITVTDERATRYFMTIPEACHLVVQAGGIGQPGEVLILDMGEPVRIMDVAERMIARSGRDISIVFTGLRDGEKLHEELVGEGEADERPKHPKISHAVVGALDPAVLDEASWVREMEGGRDV